MATYEIPASLLDDFLEIKTHLARKFAIYFLSGNSELVSYRKACKDLKKKPAKHDRQAARQIYTNIYVLRFITKAKELLALNALDEVEYSFAARLRTTQEVINIGLELYRLGAKTNAADVLKAVEIQNEMLGIDNRFEEMPLEELKRLAGENDDE